MTNYEYYAIQDVILCMAARIESGSSVDNARTWAEEELDEIAEGDGYVREEELRQVIVEDGYDPDAKYNAEIDTHDEEAHICALAKKYGQSVDNVRFLYMIVGREKIEESMQFAQDEMQRLAVLQEQVRGK